MSRDAIGGLPRSVPMTPGDLRSLRTLHEGVAAKFGDSLSTLLRSPAEVRLAGVDQLTYGKFVFGLESPSYFNVLKADPLGDRLLLDIDLSILYPMLDRMLGGGREDDPAPRRPPSDIELPLAARVVRLFAEELCLAWQSVLPLTIEVLQVESHPRLLRVLPSDEMVALVSFRLTIGDRRGMMRLCLPCRALRQIADGPADARSAERSPSPSAAGGDSPTKAEDSPSVELAVTLATSSITAADLSSLRVGDIIATETPADAPAVVSVAGAPKFFAKPGVCEGRKVVVLSEATDDASS